MTVAPNGLGRGLSSILTGPGRAAPSGPALRVRFVDDALTSLAATGRLGICAYLHDPDGEADLTMRSPDLSALHPTEAYRLFAALSSIDTSDAAVQRVPVGRRQEAAGIVVSLPEEADPGAGPTRGVFFVGDDDLDDERIERLARRCRAHGPLVRAGDRAITTDERADPMVRDAVADGGGLLTVARAAVGSIDDPSADDIGVERVDGGSAGAVVLTLRLSGQTIRAAAPIDDDPAIAAAVAARRAVAALAVR